MTDITYPKHVLHLLLRCKPPNEHIDALRKHQARNGVPAVISDCVCVVRTGTHSRRIPVYLAILHWLLYHVRESASHPLHLVHNFRWIYSSTAAYIVDANPGRSSSAVAMNSCFRGVAAFVFTEAAVPLQDSLGDGGLYTLWAGILVLCELIILLVRLRGGTWREAADKCEKLPELGMRVCCSASK